MSAALGLQAVEEIAARLDWDGKPEGFPDAVSFLSRGGAGQRSRVVVYLVAERASEPRGGRGPVVQVVTAEIGVVFLLPRRNDRGGEKARQTAEEWVDAARRRLLASGASAWQPPSASRPIVLLGGQLEPHDVDENYWVWLDRYTVEWVLDSQRFNGA